MEEIELIQEKDNLMIQLNAWLTSRSLTYMLDQKLNNKELRSKLLRDIKIFSEIEDNKE